MPVALLSKSANLLAAKAAMLGKAQAWYESVSSEPMPLAAIAAISHELPTTTTEAIQSFNIEHIEAATIEYGRLKAAENIVALTESARHKLKKVVLGNRIGMMAGDQSETVSKLRTDLLYTFGELNRDWRRIAITETGEMANQGLISSLPIGASVMRIEAYDDACPFCKKLNNRVFKVVSPDDPEKDGTTDVWLGKTNLGRSASPRKSVDGVLEPRAAHELWWAAAGLQHPNCRGMWQVVEQVNRPINPELERIINAAWGIKHGLEAPKEAT
jgi:hypothetical protein